MNINILRIRVKRGFFCVSLASLLSLVTLNNNAMAYTASEVKELAEKTVQVSVNAQLGHEEWLGEESELLETIDNLEEKIEFVRWQRQNIAIYQAGIEEKIVALKAKAVAMEIVNLELLPILEMNLKQLKETVDADIPVNISNRRKSLVHVQSILHDYDSGLLNKTRAVLGAVAAEVDLGHQIEVFEDEIVIADQFRRVKVLQVGRVGLYAMTLDHERAFQWDNNSSQWQVVKDGIVDIREGIEIAEGVRLMGFSRLPMNQPVAIAEREKR